MRANPHDSACKALEPSLELHAESELWDPVERDAVRQHLLVCARCRATLRSHDELTEAILSSEAPVFDDGLRADHIVERIQSLPRHPRTPLRLDLSVPASGALRPSPPRLVSRWSGSRGFVLGLLSCAAAFALAALLALQAFRVSDRPREDLDETASVVRSTALDSSEKPAPEATPERRWILDEAFAETTKPATPASGLLRMYGFDLFASDSPSPKSAEAQEKPIGEAGWIVDAARSGANLSERARYFLVPDTSEGTGTTGLEIDPVAYYRSSPLLPAEARLRRPGVALYRVYAVPSTARLERRAELNYPGTPPAWGPSRRPQAWITPALWER